MGHSPTATVRSATPDPPDSASSEYAIDQCDNTLISGYTD
jgi:hypothetical protein